MSDKVKDTPMDYKQFEGHTPGPWRLHEHRLTTVIGGPDSIKISESSYAEGLKPTDKVKIINGIAHTRKADEAVANAKLIAAAPDLLKENKELRMELQKQKELNAELVKGLKDITKAMSFRGGFPHTTNVFELLIKKSSEI